MRVQRWAVVAVPIRGKRGVIERTFTKRGALRACAAYLGTGTGRLMVPGPDGWPTPLVDYVVERAT